MSAQVLVNKGLKYWAIFQVGRRNASVYLVDLWSLGIMVGIRVGVITQLYTATFLSIGVVVVDGFTIPMTVWSVMVANALQLCSATRQIIFELQDEIKNGNIAHIMGKPYSLPTYFILIYFGRFRARFIPAVLIGGLFAWMFVGMPDITILGILTATILAIFGFFLNASISLIIALGSFWIEDVSAYRWIYDKAQWALSGMVIPLAIFPGNFKTLIEYSPFGQLFYSAGRMLVGFDTLLFLKYFATQIFWLAIMLILVAVIYRKGTKNVSINGG